MGQQLSVSIMGISDIVLVCTRFELRDIVLIVVFFLLVLFIAGSVISVL